MAAFFYALKIKTLHVKCHAKKIKCHALSLRFNSHALKYFRLLAYQKSYKHEKNYINGQRAFTKLKAAGATDYF